MLLRHIILKPNSIITHFSELFSVADSTLKKKNPNQDTNKICREWLKIDRLKLHPDTIKNIICTRITRSPNYSGELEPVFLIIKKNKYIYIVNILKYWIIRPLVKIKEERKAVKCRVKDKTNRRTNVILISTGRDY